MLLGQSGPWFAVAGDMSVLLFLFVQEGWWLGGLQLQALPHGLQEPPAEGRALVTRSACVHCCGAGSEEASSSEEEEVEERPARRGRAARQRKYAAATAANGPKPQRRAAARKRGRGSSGSEEENTPANKRQRGSGAGKTPAKPAFTPGTVPAVPANAKVRPRQADGQGGEGLVEAGML